MTSLTSLLNVHKFNPALWGYSQVIRQYYEYNIRVGWVWDYITRKFLARVRWQLKLLPLEPRFGGVDEQARGRVAQREKILRGGAFASHTHNYAYLLLLLLLGFLPLPCQNQIIHPSIASISSIKDDASIDAFCHFALRPPPKSPQKCSPRPAPPTDWKQ
jgi:hypothetical protein